MPPQKFNLKLLAVRYLTNNVKEFDIEKPEDAEHQPGQFMTVKIDDGKEGVCMRSYSVLYTPDKKNLQLCIKLVEGGRGSGWFFDCKAGNVLEVLYPAGCFMLPGNLTDKLVFIGTGTGLVPLLCMLESFSEGFDKEVTLIFGVRYEKDLFYVDRINKLKEKLANFNPIFTLSRPDEGWEGAKGRVTEHLQNPDPDAQYYVCGSGVVLKDVCTHLEEKGVPTDNIFHENFG